jgi:hypothetical protein
MCMAIILIDDDGKPNIFFEEMPPVKIGKGTYMKFDFKGWFEGGPLQ